MLNTKDGRKNDRENNGLAYRASHMGRALLLLDS
jgi:hypothetical protein